MEIEESAFVEELVNSNRHVVTNAEHCTKGIGTRTQVSNLAQEFHRVAFFLKWISIITNAQHFNLTSLNFGSLSGTYRFHQFTVYTDTCTGCNLFQHIFIKVSQIHYHLYIIYSRTIIQRDKVYLFATTTSTHPTFHIDHCTEITAFQKVYNFCSTNCFHLSVI